MNQLTLFIVLVLIIVYINANPVSRCSNSMDDSCIDDGVLRSEKVEEWSGNPSNTPEKQNLNDVFYQYLFGLKQMNLAKNVEDSNFPLGYRIKKCANLLDEGCINGGIIGGGNDEEWINSGNTPGKRNIITREQARQNMLWKYLKQLLRKVPHKRCANLLDESCINGGVVGSGNDEDWLNGGGTPGK